MCRLTGTNADIANRMLKEYSEKNPKLKIDVAVDLDDAAVKSAAKVKKNWCGIFYELFKDIDY